MGQLKATLKAGLLVRAITISHIRNICFQNNLKYSIEEDRGSLESNYRIVITGPDDRLQAALPAIKRATGNI